MASRSTRTGRVVVALDGPASSGKSSVGGAAAEQLGLRFVDTGLFYRALTALALREGVTADDSSALVGLVDRITLADDGSGRLTHVLLDGEDATDEARGPVVDASVSMFARVPEVRQALLDRQRTLASDGGIVMAGRDIGTVVLPEADLKLFLDASIEERANRRIEERGLDPAGDEAEEVREQLRVRDAIDTGRETAPLRAAADAVHVRTDGNAFADTVEIVAAEIARVMLTPPKATRTRRTRASSKESGAGASSAPPTPSATASPKPAAKPRRARPTARARSAKPTSTREDVATPAHESLPTTDPGPFSVAAAVASVDASSGPVRPGGPFHVGHPGPEPAGPLPEGAAVVPEAAADLPAYRGEPDLPEGAHPVDEADAQPVPTPARERERPSPPPASSAVSSRLATNLEAARRLDNDQTMLVRMIALGARITARALMDVRVEGLENVPRRGAVIFAVNHISNADSLVVGAWVSDALKRRRIHWLGKKEIFDWPVLGRVAASGGIHPVDRDAADVDAFRLAIRILDKGYALLVFPEGTRSPTGELQEAKDGAGMLALRTGAQVVPIGISNTDHVWRKGQPLPTPFPRRTVTMRIGTQFRVQDAIPEGTDRRTAKTLATTAIMHRIAALLDPRHRGVYADAIRERAPSEP